MGVQHLHWEEQANGMNGKGSRGKGNRNICSGRSVPHKVVGEKSAMTTGLLDKTRWENIPTCVFADY